MEYMPKRGDILSCNFPLNEAPDAPGPQSRPSLVLGSFPNSRNRNVMMVIIAYGTSRTSRVNLGSEIKISTLEQMKACSLHRPTRFTLNRLRILPFTPEYFDHTIGETPFIGALAPSEMSQLSRHLDMLAGHAEELNFFRPKEAMASGKRFDPNVVDAFMKRELTGIQKIKNDRKDGRPRNRQRRAS